MDMWKRECEKYSHWLANTVFNKTFRKDLTLKLCDDFLNSRWTFSLLPKFTSSSHFKWCVSVTRETFAMKFFLLYKYNKVRGWSWHHIINIFPSVYNPMKLSKTTMPQSVIQLFQISLLCVALCLTHIQSFQKREKYINLFILKIWHRGTSNSTQLNGEYLWFCIVFLCKFLIIWNI